MFINNKIKGTATRYSDMVDSYAYLIAGQMLELREEYILLYIKKKPKYFPSFIYNWFIKKFVVITEFKK